MPKAGFDVGGVNSFEILSDNLIICSHKDVDWIKLIIAEGSCIEPEPCNSWGTHDTNIHYLNGVGASDPQIYGIYLKATETNTLHNQCEWKAAITVPT